MEFLKSFDLQSSDEIRSHEFQKLWTWPSMFFFATEISKLFGLSQRISTWWWPRWSVDSVGFFGGKQSLQKCCSVSLSGSHGPFPGWQYWRENRDAGDAKLAPFCECACVCARVLLMGEGARACVWAWEREREREGEILAMNQPVTLLVTGHPKTFFVIVIRNGLIL